MRFLRTFLIFLRHYRFRDEQVDWKRVDKKALEAYLASASGLKLLIALENRSAYADEAALASSGDRFENGFAQGYRHALAFIKETANFDAFEEESHTSKTEPDPWDEDGLSKYVP